MSFSLSEALRTVVNEVVIRVFGNDELKSLLKSTEKGIADEGMYSNSSEIYYLLCWFYDQSFI